jgi:hypothetical protein
MVSASPAATFRPSINTFSAAFMSRSCVTPQPPQVHSRTCSDFRPEPSPQCEHVWDDGNHRPTFTTCRWYRSAFSSNSRTRVAQPASCTDFASLVRASPDTARSSTYTACLSRISRGPVCGAFHAVAEAFVDRQWRVVDGTLLAPRSSLLRIATGRDAADTAFLDSFGGGITFNQATVTAVTHGRLPGDDPRTLVTLG